MIADRSNTAIQLNAALNDVYHAFGKSSIYSVEKLCYLVGITCSLCLMPVMYYYGSKAGQGEVLLEVLFGTSSAVAFASLFSDKSGKSFAKTFDYSKSKSLKRLTLTNKKKLIIHTLLWVIGFAASLPLTYLNDKAGFFYFDIPVILSQMAVYRWSQENFYNALLSPTINFYKQCFNKQDSRDDMKKLLAHSSKIVKSKNDGELSEMILTFSSRASSRSGNSSQLLLDIDFISMVKSLRAVQLSSLNQSEVNETCLTQTVGFIGRTVGWLMGIVSASAYYLVGLKTPQFFLQHYFHANSSDVISKAIAVVAFWCQASLSGWSANEVFNKLFRSIVGVFERTGNHVEERRGVRTTIYRMMPVVLCALFASAAAIPRLEITEAETTSLFLDASAFVGVFAISYVGFSTLRHFVTERRNTEKDSLLTTLSLFENNVDGLDERYIDLVLQPQEPDNAGLSYA